MKPVVQKKHEKEKHSSKDAALKEQNNTRPEKKHCEYSLKKAVLRKTKIQTRLIISFLVLSIIPLACIGYLAVSMSGSAVVSKIESYSAELVNRTGEYLDLKTSEILSVNKEITLSDSIQKDLPIMDQMTDLERNQVAKAIERYMLNKFIKDEHVICSILPSSATDFKYGYASAIGVVLLIMCLIVTFIINRCFKSENYEM
ncbi:MAG: hypothetical protein N2376_10510 [Clostridia bacterium]|nr:hypothetical protein [Clostridia bacterium]